MALINYKKCIRFALNIYHLPGIYQYHTVYTLSSNLCTEQKILVGSSNNNDVLCHPTFSKQRVFKSHQKRWRKALGQWPRAHVRSGDSSKYIHSDRHKCEIQKLYSALFQGSFGTHLHLALVQRVRFHLRIHLLDTTILHNQMTLPA